MKVLALDIATRTGLCFGAAGQKPVAWAVDLGAGKSEDYRLAHVLTLTGEVIEAMEPDLLAVEAPVGGRDTSALLVGLVACARGEAHRRGVRVVSYFPATIRKHFLGKALTARDFPSRSRASAKTAIKGEVLRRCVMLGWDVDGLDEADAAALWDYACAMESRAHQMTSVGGLFGRSA